MEALEKPKEKRMKSGGPHGTKTKSATVDPAATHQHVRLRIKLPVSPARNLAGSTKGVKSTTGASVITNHDPAVSDPSDHKSSDTEPASPVPEYQDFSNTTLKELRVILDCTFHMNSFLQEFMHGFCVKYCTNEFSYMKFHYYRPHWFEKKLTFQILFAMSGSNRRVNVFSSCSCV